MSDPVFDYATDAADADDAAILDPEQAMGLDAEEELADGWSPPDTPTAVDEVGTTLAEQRAGETLTEREMRSHPESWRDPEVDPEVTDRLRDDAGDGILDEEKDLVADVARGDSQGLTAEEAAVHRIGGDDPLLAEAELIAEDEGSTNG